MPTSGHDGDKGLLDLADLSLEDLSRLDDSVVANVIRGLLERRRCGDSAEQFSNNWNASP
jgi:hypothetical protein